MLYSLCLWQFCSWRTVSNKSLPLISSQYRQSGSKYCTISLSLGIIDDELSISTSPCILLLAGQHNRLLKPSHMTHCAEVFDSWSWRHLWQFLPATCEEHGYQRSPHCSKVTLAKSILRTGNRLNKKRMFGSLHYPKRKSFVSHSQRLHGLLQQLQNSSFAW